MLFEIADKIFLSADFHVYILSMDRQLTLEEALSRIAESYTPKTRTAGRYRLSAHIKGFEFDMEYYGLITPREDLFDFHSYHTKDGGKIGYFHYCKTCHKSTDYNETRKGLEVDGKVIFFTNEEIEGLKQSRGLLITSLYAGEVRPERIKGSYALSPYEDGREQRRNWNRTFYDVLLEQLKEDRRPMIALVKMSSTGFKGGIDRGMLSYDEGKNRVVLNTVYYSDEVSEVPKYEEGRYEPRKLGAAKEKLFADFEPADEDPKSPQIRAILGLIRGKREEKVSGEGAAPDALDYIINS